jgi:large subunit ribosomal protein L23
MNITEIVKGPIITEKLDQARESYGHYAFLVDTHARKTEIRHAIEKLFKVNVIEVRTSIVRGKRKRIGRSIGLRPNWKRAVVRLKEGQSIELFVGE